MRNLLKMSILYVYAIQPAVHDLLEDYLRIRRHTDSGFDIPLLNAIVKSVSGSQVSCIDQGIH